MELYSGGSVLAPTSSQPLLLTNMLPKQRGMITASFQRAATAQLLENGLLARSMLCDMHKERAAQRRVVTGVLRAMKPICTPKFKRDPVASFASLRDYWMALPQADLARANGAFFALPMLSEVPVLMWSDVQRVGKAHAEGEAALETCARVLLKLKSAEEPLPPRATAVLAVIAALAAAAKGAGLKPLGIVDDTMSSDTEHPTYTALPPKHRGAAVIQVGMPTSLKHHPASMRGEVWVPPQAAWTMKARPLTAQARRLAKARDELQSMLDGPLLLVPTTADIAALLRGHQEDLPKTVRKALDAEFGVMVGSAVAAASTPVAAAAGAGGAGHGSDHDDDDGSVHAGKEDA